MPVEAVTMPPLPLRGGCQCGQVRYGITAAPVSFYLCHCRECQLQSSSAFGESLRVRRGDIAVEGALREDSRSAAEGERPGNWFCGECGTRILHGTADDAVVSVKAGTLDDASWLVPAGHLWTVSKQRFVAIGADELAYERDPDSGDALAERWRLMLEKGGIPKM